MVVVIKNCDSVGKDATQTLFHESNAVWKINAFSCWIWHLQQQYTTSLARKDPLFLEKSSLCCLQLMSLYKSHPLKENPLSPGLYASCWKVIQQPKAATIFLILAALMLRKKKYSCFKVYGGAEASSPRNTTGLSVCSVSTSKWHMAD